ncbi:hypothetical protein V5740_09975 [Croceibacterium sp. TMG7-5b_MA50]|uniref:hypothetical protein n=1 Tax=Croceibacterium sp. TMG7-5b_MA50 TaxID=3121290 RepID=UPI003221F428
MHRRAALLLLLLLATAPAACGPAEQAPVPQQGEEASLRRAEAMLAERPDTAQEKGPARE